MWVGQMDASTVASTEEMWVDKKDASTAVQ